MSSSATTRWRRLANRRGAWWTAAVALVLLTVAWWVGQPSASPSRRAARPPQNGGAAIGERKETPAEELIQTKRIAARRASLQQSLDPRQDGWDSEVAAQRVLARLAVVGHILEIPRRIEARRLASLATGDGQYGSLRPVNLTTVYRDAFVEVRRADSPGNGPQRTGAAGLAKGLRELTAGFLSSGPVHTHFKVIVVTETAESVESRVLYEAHGHGRSGPLQQRAQWDCSWARHADQLRLSAVRVTDYEEAASVATDSPWFADGTEAVLGENPSFHKQMMFGLNHWLSRVERVHRMQIYLRSGLAVGDVNGDGRDDLYVCQPGGLPNRLYVQTEQGAAVDRSSWAGVDFMDKTASSLIIDLDNDGDQDLVLALHGMVLFLENDGQGRFRPRNRSETKDADLQSLSAADYDNDGDLDVYVCVDFASPTGQPGASDPPFIYHDANDGGSNMLLRNETISQTSRSWQFTDVTAEAGLAENNQRHSLAAAWEDFDNDGDVDLYVANDYGQNCLYRNSAGRFRDIAREAGVVDYGSGMSVSWGDYDRDGLMDLYVGNMFSSAGNRIARQARFKPDADPGVRALYRRFAKGNTLFRNRGDGRFEDVGSQAAVEMGRWAWSSLLADLNNDGWQDIVVANGYISHEDTDDL